MLQPDIVFLDLLHDLIKSDIDYAEVTPETLWRVGEDRLIEPNGFHRQFLDWKRERGLSFVAHSVSYCLGSDSEIGAQERAKWIARMKRDAELFGFSWLTEHLGASSMAGENLALPVPLPMTATHAAIVRRRLREMQQAVSAVGIENSVFYYLHGSPMDEPAFIRETLLGADTHLLLDLHNVHTMASNFDFDPLAYVDALPLERVIEIHLAGGTESDPSWLASGDTMRLDSHDSHVPKDVWRLFDAVVDRCPNLRGVTLERMEGTVTAQDVGGIRDEIRRAKQRIQSGEGPLTLSVPASFKENVSTVDVSKVAPAPLLRFEEAVAAAFRNADPTAAFRAIENDVELPASLREAARTPQSRGIEISALLIIRLRFERLIQTSSRASAWYDSQPREFTQTFRDYHRSVPSSTEFGMREARDFDTWCCANARWPTDL